MDSEWYEFCPGPAPTVQRIRWQSDSDADRMIRRRRGRLSDPAGLRLTWTGISNPPDVLGWGLTCTLLSRRLYDRLSSAGVKGMGCLGVTVETAEGAALGYVVLVVPREVESVCFRNSRRGEDRLYRLSGPKVRGLDTQVSDFFILPADLGLHNVLISRRVAELLQRGDYSNLALRPLEELDVALPDPDHALC